ncbi:septum site-determining protein MinD [Hartmannibacter diazotrophicus]|uniref:Septum site-determining protein MinD n=1 Tax=Hartmannibacter diazotrophicus TaxID=1482074 RepID=A0A2C9D2F2_9HYPH|nr:AAA family ATPase [Hartmannibacter diazotrophicus]SON54413.1 septum site-determining protein MinD [Hartmannibacter diazotrophicus]
MSDYSFDMDSASARMASLDVPADDFRPIPRISLQAFVDSPEIARVLDSMAADRRMARTHVKIHMGGLNAANDFYLSAPTPNLLMVESPGDEAELLAGLDELAGICDSGTKVVVLGLKNDVFLYRELLRRGISEYLVFPFDMFSVIRMIGELYFDPNAEPVGRTVAFLGSKGGCGSSTIAHNVAFSLSKASESDVVIADMDLPFGTAGLDFNQDPTQGIADAVFTPERIDDVFLDRILSKCSDNLSLLAAPATLERVYDFKDDDFVSLLETVRVGVPTVVLDVPHVWSGWVKRTLSVVDDIVITATPDLASLRNVKNMMDQLKLIRPTDHSPRLVLNQVGMPKRPEIKAADFEKALNISPVAIVPFDAAMFGAAANNGQMIAEYSPKSPTVGIFEEIGRVIAGRGVVQKAKRSALAPLMAKLGRGKTKKSA